LNKQYFLLPNEIKDIALGHGSCFATDEITVSGNRVGFMYRESPDNEIDSGWRFFSGLESQEYIDEPNNLAIYDVNTIANYDPEIISYLSAPIGSAFGRNENGEFMAEEEPLDPDA
jgi:hypothetical protein